MLRRKQCFAFVWSNRVFCNVVSRKSSTTTDKGRHEWILPVGHDTGIKVFNTLTRTKVPLILPKKNHLSWYVCGPTVYSSAHVGHASTYMKFDIVRRVLTNFFDINVTYLMGITDIDDKIINRCIEIDEDMTVLTSHYEREFFKELAQLNIHSPTLVSRVTEHIPNIIAFVQGIMDKGCAYVGADGSVYFDLVKYGIENYGKLIKTQEVKDDPKQVKKSNFDFALWKAAKPGEPFWDSPWGHGRPGWHIECSAMASHVFGSSLDFHSGGMDLKFPHHENELAQSQSFFSCQQWANYWLHSGLLMSEHDVQKMSKSLRNIVTIEELLTKYTANQFRMFCMMGSLSNTHTYSEASMEKACVIDNKIGHFLRLCDTYVKGQFKGGDMSEAEVIARLNETEEMVFKALRNNFDTPTVITVLESLIQYMHSKLIPQGEVMTSTVTRCPGAVAAVSLYVKRVCKKLGFNKKGWKPASNAEDEILLKNVIQNAIDFRADVRKYVYSVPLDLPDTISQKQQKKIKKDLVSPLWKTCDDFRDKMLKTCNISIQDSTKDRDVGSWDFVDSLPGKK